MVATIRVKTLHFSGGRLARTSVSSVADMMGSCHEFSALTPLKLRFANVLWRSGSLNEGIRGRRATGDGLDAAQCAELVILTCVISLFSCLANQEQHPVGRRLHAWRNRLSEVTRILEAIDQGDPTAAEQLLPLIYDELRQLAEIRMASERQDHTLQATALVHEVYLRMFDAQRAQHWNSRGHFFSAAADAMRRILVDSARAKQSQKRGGDWQRVMLQDFIDSDTVNPDLLLDLDEGLSRLAKEDAVSAELVKLRVFAGLSVTEAGQALEMSRTSAYENWEFACSWFARYLDTPSA
jgi:RNA polymerase sigma factor (TIGR02999 family)